MAVVAGVVFLIVRALLALSSTLAMRCPIKKCEAAVVQHTTRRVDGVLVIGM
jgi:hypothetical protein